MPEKSNAKSLQKLVAIADVASGFSVTGPLAHEDEGTHQVLLTRHLRQGRSYTYGANDALRIVPGRDASRYEIHAGDVVFMSRGTRNLSWAIETVFDPTIVPVSFYILRPKAGVDARYLAWYLNQEPAQAALDQIRTGAGTPIIQRQAFMELEVVLPPLEKQRAIADLGQLQARERELREQLAAASSRANAATGRRIIEQLRTV